MNQKKPTYSRLKRWSRRLLWAIGLLLLLVAVVRLSLKTSVVQNWVKDYAVSAANEQLTAELSIDKLAGDLWNGFTASGIRMEDEEPIAQIDSLQVAYNIWSLWDGKIEVNRLAIYKPQFNLRQRAGQWNVKNLTVESDQSTTSDEGLGLGVQIDDLNLTDGQISVQSDSLPVESNFDISGLAINSSFSYQDQGFDMDLRSLSFQVNQTQLDSPLKVETSATAKSNEINLEKLVLATGNSMIRSSAFVNSQDSSVTFDLSASPISWKDITDYASNIPIRKDVQLNLGVQGNPEQFEVTLNLQADGLESLELASQFQWQSNLVLQQFTLESGYIDPAILLADTTLPSVNRLNAEFTGEVDLADYRNGFGDVRLEVDQITQGPYRLDMITGTAKLKDQNATINLKAQQQNQQVDSKISVNQVWSDLPTITANIQALHINPEYWAQDSTLAGDLSFSSKISGRGWYPESTQWNYSLTMRDAELGGQPISSLSANGKLSMRDISMDARLNIRESITTLSANIRGFASRKPSYNYNLQTRRLDLGPLLDIENFTTGLRATLKGQGQGFDPGSMQFTSSVQVDSSLINGELISNFTADLSIRDTVVVIDSTSLQSTIADGSISARMNLLRRYDSQNELAMNLTLKDIRSLGPVVNTENLQAEGKINGKLSPVDNENLKFIGSVDLSDIAYNQFFNASGANGSVEVILKKDLEYMADLDLSSPSFSGFQLQDLNLMTAGTYKDPQVSGQYKFQFSSPNEGRIEQAGNYSFAGDSINVHTTTMNFVSDYRTLSLERPFNLTVHGDTVRMDTMRISDTDDSAFLEMAVPVVNAREQRAFVHGESLNTSVIQSCLLGETYFEGMLSGQFEIVRKDTNLDAKGQLLLSELVYQDTRFDSLLIKQTINNERLKGTLTLRDEGKQLIDGSADLPFKLGDPEELASSFFEQPVSGSMRIREISVENFRSLLPDEVLAGTSGLFSFRGSLDGKAGSPEFTANASLRKATLSGVSVDSVTAGFDYYHDKSQLALNASVMSLRQRAAQVSASIPLFIDMKTFKVDLPQEDDSISVDIETNDFNLAAMNDFVDRHTIRNISGRMDGMVHILGPVDNLETDGKLALRNGSVRLVQAGIRVDNIQSDISFAPNQIRLTKFSARSGNGSMNASGMIELEKLVPGNMDIKVEAKNFRAANTSEYNAVINLDARAQGTFTRPKITGNLSFISGFLQLRNFGEKSVENIQLDSLEQSDYNISVYDSLSLDVDISFNRRFFIRNQRYLEMEIELDGELDLLKDPGKDLQLFGTMMTSSGYARPLGKRFSLQEGSVTFIGDPTNPQLMIRTQYEPPQTQEEIVIWYVIEGTVENPKFKYESQPPMELENIISYTLFGQPFYALDSWKQVVANSGSNMTAADVALDVLLDRVEALATQKLGIDVVKIDNTRSGGENGTSITTGWYLNPKVFFAIQNVITGSTPDTSFILEYLFQKNLKLIIRQGNGIRQGVDVQWNYDY